MKKIENECVGCGLPCLGDGCPNRNVARFYCDECEEEEKLYRYDGKELCEMFVRKDVGAEGVVEEEILRDGASEAYISLYKVKIEGLTITELIPLYTKIQNPMKDLQNQIKSTTSVPTTGEEGDVYIVTES